jgi:hypothetical protein
VFSPVLVESLQRLLARLTQLLHLFVPRVLPTFGVEGGHSGSRFVVPLNGTKVDLIQSPALFTRRWIFGEYKISIRAGTLGGILMDSDIQGSQSLRC